MKDSISRLLARTRALFSRRAAPETPVAPAEPALEPEQAPEPEPEHASAAPEPMRPHCGVYVWATAHGIDLRPTTALLTCTCSEDEEPVPIRDPAPAADTELLRAKVREVNARSTWGK
ncbi:hypothetical protein [Streptomyces sp. NPDC008001]|uniref:hypothetical protein n=1 Tax=Streptomyces sp. NPDC008001 TaxID=3364804 RepID=UPI0036E4C223